MKAEIEVEGILTGWKQIRNFLGGVSRDTARRYGKKHHMPIYRLPGGTPAAMPHELRIWLQGAPGFLKAVEIKKSDP